MLRARTRVVIPLFSATNEFKISFHRTFSKNFAATMPKRGRRRKKARTHDDKEAAVPSALATKNETVRVPQSLVIRRGKCAGEVHELVDDLRQMMLPFTALRFEEDPKNRKLTLSQYATHLALPMGVTHILSFSQNQERLNLRLARTPEGPTLSFRVHRFSLNRQIKALQKRPVAYGASLHSNPPIVVTNNFGGDANTSAAAAPHTKLMRITFQNLFPAINVSTVKLRDCRRVVLFHLLEEEEDGKQVVQIRHYAIKATPTGVHRRVRRLVQSKVPNLHKCQDISEYLSNAIMSDAPSDSEAEDDPSHQVKLPDNFVGRGNSKSQTSALKLVELGPRLSVELLKVEKGLGGGDILYHAHVKKNPQEAAALKARKENERSMKDQRRTQQDANVERKRKEQDEKRDAKRKRREDKEHEAMDALRQGQDPVASGDSSDEESDEEESDGGEE
jgi:ribosome biogenesis protein SSF1/2